MTDYSALFYKGGVKPSGPPTVKQPTSQVSSFKNRGVVGSAITQTQTTPGIQSVLATEATPADEFSSRQQALRTQLSGHNKWSQQINDYMRQAKANTAGNANSVATRGSGYTGNSSALSDSGYSGAQQLAGQTSGLRGQIVSAASKMLGTPYAWGGGGIGVKSSYGIGKGTQNTFGVDCSGLTSYVYGQFGINLPRTANSQTTTGIRTNINNARAGDLVGWSRGGHIAIYAGNGYIIESPNVGKTVRLRKLGSNESVYAVKLTLPGD